MPGKGNFVVVKFYDNFRQVESGVGVNPDNGEPPNYEDEKGNAHHRFRFRCVADGGTYRIGVYSDAYNVEEKPETRFTGPIAFDADAATIAAALNAIASTVGTPFEWVGVADEPSPNRHEVDCSAAHIGALQKLPLGFFIDSTGLFGHLIWEWDEIKYEVELEQGGCGSAAHTGEIFPGGERAGRVPSVRRVKGGRVGEPEKRESLLPGNGRRSPN